MKRVAKMMAARNRGEEWRNDPNRRIGFDSERYESEMQPESRGYRNENNARYEGRSRYADNARYDGGARYENRMNGYNESRRRSPDTGRFIRGYAEGEMYSYAGPEKRHSKEHMQYGHGEGEEEEESEFSEQMAHKWTKGMKGAGGSKGAHWTKEQTRAVMTQHGIVCDPIKFYAVMNAMYADYSQVAKTFDIDRPEFYAMMAKAWLEDPDAEEDKATLYFKYIVKKE